MQILNVMVSSLSARIQSKNLAEQVIWPEESANKIKTSNVISDNLNAILSQITGRTIDDKCSEYKNCTGKSFSKVFAEALSILTARAGNTGSIGYKSVQKNEIKQHKFQLKRDNNLFKLKNEEVKQEMSNKTENGSSKKSKKYVNNNTIEMEIKDLNPENFNDADNSDDEMEQNSEEEEATTNGVEYFVFGGNKIAAIY